MAGRAGRRGLDTVGTVILCAFGSEPPPMPMLRNMLTGQSTLLKSQFRLTYNVRIYSSGIIRFRKARSTHVLSCRHR